MSLKRGMLAFLAGSLEIQKYQQLSLVWTSMSPFCWSHIYSPKRLPILNCMAKQHHIGVRENIYTSGKKIKGLKTNLSSYRELILTLFLRTDTSERTDFSINSIGETGYPHRRKIMKFTPSFILYTKFSSKGIANISIDLVIVLIISFLMGNDIEYFLCLLFIYISSLEKRLFRTLTHL